MAFSVARMPAGNLCLPATGARRRQSPILDRWDRRHACEMIATIERQSHEAELSALSNLRASSLIQMWREMEAEASPRGGAASTAAELVFGGSDAENERERKGVGKMVRSMSLKMSSWTSSSSDELEMMAGTKEQFQNGLTAANLPAFGGGGKVVRVRGRKEMEGLVMRMKEERLREIAELAEEQRVSRFPFRGKIQSLIRLRFLRQQAAATKDQHQRSIKFESEELQGGSNGIFLREITQDITQHYANKIESEDHTTDFQNSDFGISVNPSETEESQFTELFRAEDLQIENQKSDASSNERISWENSTDSKLPDDSLQIYQREILIDETENFTRSNWLFEQSFAENVEIRELLDRKTVSNFLAGELSHKLNQLIMSFIEKKGLQYDDKGREGCEEEEEEEEEEETMWRRNYEDFSDQDPSESFMQNSSASGKDEDAMNDMRDGFAQIQSELSELRKMVESCLEWQKRIDFSINEEFSSAINQSVKRGKSSHKTKWKDSCCICCEAQVDTVLYRCGHMCACFKCSQGLQWSNECVVAQRKRKLIKFWNTNHTK
ncbi:uncharacterized protein LOC110030839 isoform X2 [Phalaenopsis equestris]|uniref:uncharacterized protein LOC110030839 isoform X2 n=1 Tax=Phalaenopsis equestris TaxID=78828 RepID=UPI0009E1BC86|nr:uncharacterized protein LOC110030839 isoform X2 [Phalaenopsis equestris]